MDKNEWDKNNDVPDKWDFISANTFVLSLIIGLIMACFALISVAG